MKQYKSVKTIYRDIRSLSTWLLAGLTLVFGNWASSSIYSTAKSFWNRGNIHITSWQVFTIFSFILFILLLKKYGHNLFPPRTRRLKKELLKKKKHLVLFLSDIYGAQTPDNATPKWFTPSSDLKTDINKLENIKTGSSGKKWSWEMPLRGIEGHLTRLETITLICSDKSIKLAPAFIKLCIGYKDLSLVQNYYILGKRGETTFVLNKEEFETTDEIGGYDFEDFDQLIEALSTLLSDYRKRGIDDNEIMIDITGGQKPNSIVGAVITFQNRMMFQYVRTNSPYDIQPYDVIQETPAAKGFI